jgi:DNA polymerase I-like protein with 3'-5' exonuclease and polymerase domains
VVESRFEGGSIIEGDYSQLEFRVAGFLAKDSQAYKDVTDGVDVHSYTASVIGCDRQTAKADTFKPLYGGTTGTPEQQKYYRAFKEKYSEITDWHDKLQKDAVTTKRIVLPSGRTYYFPDTKWTRYGTATNRTAICNYPVQGFATADILPCCLVTLEKKLKPYKSLICNTVHDSIVIDCHPDEDDDVLEILKDCMLGAVDDLKQRYSIEYDMPIGIEIKKGNNWLDTDVVYPLE